MMFKKAKFFHTPVEQIEQLCKEEEYVEVMINVYRTEHYSNGISEKVLIGAYGGRIKSWTDLIQFDDSDMKKLSSKIKAELR